MAMGQNPFPNAPGASSSGAVMASRIIPGAPKKKKRPKKAAKTKPKAAQPSIADMAALAIRRASQK
jgi:hypothetical protein